MKSFLNLWSFFYQIYHSIALIKFLVQNPIIIIKVFQDMFLNFAFSNVWYDSR